MPSERASSRATGSPAGLLGLLAALIVLDLAILSIRLTLPLRLPRRFLDLFLALQLSLTLLLGGFNLRLRVILPAALVSFAIGLAPVTVGLPWLYDGRFSWRHLPLPRRPDLLLRLLFYPAAAQALPRTLGLFWLARLPWINRFRLTGNRSVFLAFSRRANLPRLFSGHGLWLRFY